MSKQKSTNPTDPPASEALRARLSPAQHLVLVEVANRPVDLVWASCLTPQWRRTFGKLVDLGLIRFHPYALGKGAYKLTPLGRVRVRAMVASGEIVEDK